MIAIKIIFTILLIIPIAIFMRYLLRRLSAETPKQSYTREEIRSYNSRGRKLRSEKHKEQVAKQGSGKPRSGSGKPQSGSGKPRSGTGRPQSGSGSKGAASARKQTAASGSGKKQQSKSGGYTPRKPAEWHRSERVPFGDPEGYKSPSSITSMEEIRREHFEEGAAAEPLPLKSGNKRKRSDRTPTKRQLRKNRERARKRDLKKRKAERRQEGKNSR